MTQSASLSTGNANNQIAVMSMETAREKAPAIFATGPSPRLSKDYKFTSSLQLIEHLDAAGWKLTDARQSKSNKDVYAKYGTHIMKFSHPDIYMKDDRGGIEGRPQIVICNDHHGNRPLQIEAACFRLVCSNGLMIKTRDFASTKERHIKYTQEQVNKIVDDQLSKIETAVTKINGWLGRQLSSKEQFAFAAEALALRLNSDRVPEQYELLGVLEARRSEDKPNDLWHIFNRVEENIIKGGWELNGRTARAIQNPIADMEINLKLWEIAEKFSN